MRKLKNEFYQRSDVVKIAKELLGKILITRWDGVETSGRIVEVEAYNGIIDKGIACFRGEEKQTGMK
jgi:DNA-3-methyladenine glycosylase